MSDCPRCRTFALENENQAHEIAGLNAEILTLHREKIALKAALTRQRRQEDVSRHVMAVARMWRSLCSPRASIAPAGKNAENIRVAFINYCKGTHDERRHLLYDCVRGYALRPYDAGYGRRTANPAGAVRRVTTAYIFASEERIEQGAGYFRMAQAKPLEWKFAVWQAACATEAAWRSLWWVAQRHDDERREHWEREYGVDGLTPPQDHAAHLFLDDTQEQEPVAPVVQPLFVIEGGKAA